MEERQGLFLHDWTLLSDNSFHLSSSHNQLLTLNKMAQYSLAYTLHGGAQFFGIRSICSYFKASLTRGKSIHKEYETAEGLKPHHHHWHLGLAPTISEHCYYFRPYLFYLLCCINVTISFGAQLFQTVYKDLENKIKPKVTTKAK